MMNLNFSKIDDAHRTGSIVSFAGVAAVLALSPSACFVDFTMT